MIKTSENLFIAGVASLTVLTGLQGMTSSEAATRSKRTTTRTAKAVGKTATTNRKIAATTAQSLLLERNMLTKEALSKGVNDLVNPEAAKIKFLTKFGSVAIAETLYSGYKYPSGIILDRSRPEGYEFEPVDSIKVTPFVSCGVKEDGTVYTSHFAASVMNSSKDTIVVSATTPLIPGVVNSMSLIPFPGNSTGPGVALTDVPIETNIPYKITIGVPNKTPVDISGVLPGCKLNESNNIEHERKILSFVLGQGVLQDSYSPNLQQTTT